MRKNILLFGHSYGPQFIDINNQYTRLFDQNRYCVTVIYLDGDFSETIRAKHLADDVIFLNADTKTKRGLKIPLIRHLLRITREKQFEIVICHRYKPTYIMLWVALFYKIPALFFVMHELGTQKHFFRKVLIRLLARKNMLFAGVSNAVRDDMRNDMWGIPSEHIVTLYNMIDVDWTQSQLLNRADARAALNLPTNAFLFGNTGRLVKNKDQRTLIQAFALAKPKAANAKLVIMGSGTLEAELKQLVAELNLTDEVIFTGFVEESFRYMQAFDTYISSSTQEAFGRVLLETMLAKVPIIATAVNGVPEVVGDAGVLVPPKNPEQLATAMLNSYQQTLIEREQYGMRGFQRAVNEFSQEKFHALFWQLPCLQHLSPERLL